MSRYTSRHTGATIDDAIDRAKAGGAIDKEMANKAPSGYGYGETQNIIFWDDEDGTKLEQVLEARFASASMREKVFRTSFVDFPICKVSGNGGFADIYADANNDSNGYPNSILVVYYARGGNVNGPSMATKQKINGIWYPWEYVNPPMPIGVEYRTTERYMSNPVYVSLVDCGTLTATSSATEIRVPVAPVTSMGDNFRIISCEGVEYISAFDQKTIPVSNTAGLSVNVRAGCWSDSENIRQWGVCIYSAPYTEPYHIYAIVKYTY